MLRSDGYPQDGRDRAGDRRAIRDQPYRHGASAGALEIGEASVIVVAAAPHRKPAFEAALEGINRLKRLVPVWKKEFFADGEVWVEGEWDAECASRCCFLALSGIFAAQTARRRCRPFRSDVRLVRILATVKDQSGALVGSLDKERFRRARQRRRRSRSRYSNARRISRFRWRS